MNFRTRCVSGVILAVALIGVSWTSSAMAGAISYGDFVGATVTFLDVTEASGTDTPPLFGTPTVTGDAISFNPSSFNASSQALTPPVDLTDGTLATTIVADAGATIEGILLEEAGDYSLAGSGTAQTQVSVSTTMFIKVLEVDGVGIAPISFNDSMEFTPKADGDFNLVDDAGVGVIWEGSTLLDVRGALDAAGIAGGATKVQLSLDNTLLAVSEAGTTAFIAKKQFGGLTMTIIPEPSTLVLLGLGLAALLVSRRRKA